MKKNNKSLLKRQVENGVLPHAYLFSGADERGKNEAVKYLLDELLGKADNHELNPDFFKIESEPITINDIRLLKEKASQSPLVGRKNVLFIKNIENLSWQSGPALLKVLEEPPADSFILATTENLEKVLPTIRSRFSHLRFTNHSNAVGSVKNINPAAKPPHEKPEEFRKFFRNTLIYAESLMRKTPSRQTIERVERLLNVGNAFLDPTISRRLLGEYIMMVLF